MTLKGKQQKCYMLLMIDNNDWWGQLMTMIDDNDRRQWLMIMIDHIDWWQWLMTIIDDNDWLKWLMTMIDDIINHCYQSLVTCNIFDDFPSKSQTILLNIFFSGTPYMHGILSVFIFFFLIVEDNQKYDCVK